MLKVSCHVNHSDSREMIATHCVCVSETEMGGMGEGERGSGRFMKEGQLDLDLE